MKLKSIDLNCDLGEGYDDEAIMPFISSCNIACGGHAGNEKSVYHTVQLAKKFNLAIGAHPSYPDKINFGRVSMPLSRSELLQTIKEQIKLVIDACAASNLKLHHIKPHGALYNDMTRNKELSLAVLKEIQLLLPNITIYGLSGSKIISTAQALKLKVCSEVFADRAYANAHKLLSRNKKGAVLSVTDKVLTQVNGFLSSSLTDVHGQEHIVSADTICLHSDTPQAVELVEIIYKHLKKNNVHISAS